MTTPEIQPPSAPAAGSDGVARMLLITQCRECTHCGETMDNHWQVSGAYCRKTGKKMDPFRPIPEFCPLPPNLKVAG